ncbi:MAG: hypothetical protein J6A38_01455 [Clostridia bacterium]|nr:hypothetical protein [Clostridia bacterium]
MTFVYKKWEQVCRFFKEKGVYSIPAQEVQGNADQYLVLKHDVETNVKRAYNIAKIEHKYGHRGSYYVQAYLLKNQKNLILLKKIQEMGHEISYHYDVMDSNKGDMEKALIEFEENRKSFEENGFLIKTVCQHGNPVIERKGYTSNRDFFRSERVQELYPNLSDIMVDYAQKKGLQYTYYSDAGRKFKLIFDPFNNDLVNSDDKNIVYENLESLLASINVEGGNIISIHPHRWTKLYITYLFHATFFYSAKFIAKILIKIPFIKRILEKHYNLAKKF